MTLRPEIWIIAGALLSSSACGGGSSASATSPTPTTAGVFEPSGTLRGQCAVPRTGTDPSTGRAYADVKGSVQTENKWLRSWTNELYLWYREVPDLDPAQYPTTDAYFRLLKTSATTPSGNAKDKFHFTYPTPEWIALSQSGVSAGYGAQWAVVASRPPRKILVAYVEPSSPATASDANLARGAEVLAVDGVDVVNAADSTSVDRLNGGLFPSAPGAPHTFSIRDLGSSTPRDVTMVATNVTSTPVQNVGTVRAGRRVVGYMLFNDHIATAERQLVDAIDRLAASNIDDLVLDIRYNGGGYLDIASELAYMIAGPAAAGRAFERTIFNDKYPSTNPVTGGALQPVLFHATGQGFSVPREQSLPSLNLKRVAVLASGGTCSASEAVINGLRGVGVEVIQIGTTTCGKPYGFYPADNCGTTYFSIQFQGVNDKGFGDYSDGFSPANATSNPGVSVPGCAVGDDFSRELGDAREARFAAALGYLANGDCPAVSTVTGAMAARAGIETEVLTPKSPWLENRIMRR